MPLKLKMAVLKFTMEKEWHIFENCHTAKPSAKMPIWNVYIYNLRANHMTRTIKQNAKRKKKNPKVLSFFFLKK